MSRLNQNPLRQSELNRVESSTERMQILHSHINIARPTMPREQLRTALAIAFCLSQLFWVDLFFDSFSNDNKGRIALPLIMFCIPAIACLITKNWTVPIGAMSGYCSVISMAWFAGFDPQMPRQVQFTLSLFILGPLMALFTLAVSIPITLVRRWRHKRNLSLDQNQIE